ncbi:MAG: hypothetical protein NC114_12195 [Ruminococcus flavefaciens]|nr:hypothetical protein [Ruminococcus flavefaciens]
MNCINHPSEKAVAQCSACGRGLCRECAGNDATPLCRTCLKRHRRAEAASAALFLAAYAALFAIGYKLDFLATANHPDMRIMSGYTIMAAVSGWQFINRIIGWRLGQASAAVWFAYATAKLLAAVTAGLVTALFTVAWNMIKLIRNL